ncbi:hypothetical protein FEP14_02868 [Burkholderia multivorans]|nr:hypothetical protein [Burkholderia multivorans]
MEDETRRFPRRRAARTIRVASARRFAAPAPRAPARARALRGRSAVVQGRDHLPGAREVVLRLEQRRHRRLPGADREARLHRGTRRRRDLAAAVLSVAAPRRRLRHLRLSRRASRLRHARRRAPLHPRSACARHSRHHRARDKPYVGPASVVPARAAREAGLDVPQLLRVVRHRHEVRRHAHHLSRHRDVELDARSGRGPVLLAPLLLAPAGPELRQSGRRARSAAGHALLARPRHRRAAPRRGAVSRRARRHEQREPAGDARDPEADPRDDRRRVSEPHAARRSEPVAGGRAGILRQRGRMPHGVPLSADAAHLHVDRERGPLPDHRHHAADAGARTEQPVGRVPAQSRRAHARDGHRFRARPALADLRERPPRAPEPRDPAPARTADGARPPPHRADQFAAAVDARHARHLLRRRDRHGRQHPSRRPRRRAHADAVVVGPQRRLLARRSGTARAAARHGFAVRL